jgi:hypothetical protein
MPSKKRPGMVGRYIELTEELDRDFRAFCEKRGETFADQVRLAMRRHLKYPPPKADVPPMGNGMKKGRRKK